MFLKLTADVPARGFIKNGALVRPYWESTKNLDGFTWKPCSKI